VVRSTIRRRGRLQAGLLALVLLAASPALASVELELAFHRGVLAYGEERFDEARAQFEKVLAEDPEDTTALRYLGLIAQARGEHDAAVGYYERALDLDPEDAEVQLDLGVALLDAGRLTQARAAFGRAIALAPDSGPAQLFAGIAAYRANAFAEAVPHFERAAELDASLRDDARYYTGLCQALNGNIEAATAALGAVEEEAPLTPLARSAQNLREQLAPRPEHRRWFASLTAGMEWDDNPLIAGTNAVGVPVPSNDPDWRGVVRPHGWYRFLDTSGFSMTGGYDGYLGLQIDETEVDLQVHNPWIAAGYDIGALGLGLRVDYSYTLNDLTDPFRHLVRATPTLSYRAADWSLTQAFYQFSWKDYLVGATSGTPLDRDGQRNVWGLNQFFFLPAPFTYVRMGAYGDFNQSDGNEWSYSGMEANFGVTYDFDWDIALSWLYRFQYRSYDHPSLFSSPAPFTQQRTDYTHYLTAELAKGLTEHWVLSVGGAFTWASSNVDFYDYSRHIVGTYVTYRF
jgi:tetratricopeptide (TPR) repeat protein